MLYCSRAANGGSGRINTHACAMQFASLEEHRLLPNIYYRPIIAFYSGLFSGHTLPNQCHTSVTSEHCFAGSAPQGTLRAPCRQARMHSRRRPLAQAQSAAACSSPAATRGDRRL